MKKILDKVQQDILNYIEAQKDNNEGLTLRDIASAVGLDHPQKVANKLEQLQEKGFITKLSNGFYRIIKRISDDIIYLPLFGFAQCGIKGPEIVDEYPKSYLPFSSNLIKNPNENFIAVKAKGKSMLPIIDTGDVVIVKTQNFFEDSDLVLLSHNNEAKIKKIKRKKDTLFLHSLNPSFQDIEIVDEHEVYVIGVIKNIIKEY